MLSSQFSKYCAIVLLCLGLSACSTAAHNNKKLAAGDSYNEESLQANGIGDEASFGNSKGNALKPGCNQIYYFDYDNSCVHDADRASIEAQAKYLADHQSSKVRLEGNTDNRGSREYNIALGEHRAMSVAEILKLNGVTANQIKVVSFGAQKPVAFGNTEEDYQLNRRVELIYEKK